MCRYSAPLLHLGAGGQVQPGADGAAVQIILHQTHVLGAGLAT